MLLLGIDIGTSACKIAAFDENGGIVAEAVCGYPVYSDVPGYAEQDPEEWYAAVSAGVRRIVGQVGAGAIGAVGIDGQSWSCIPIDRAGRVLARTPIWYDTRSAEECRQILDTIGEERIFSVCKNPVQPAYTTPKALWFKRNMPEVYQNTAYFLQSNAYIGFRLTGEVSQDPSQGYGNFFYDMQNGTYDGALCEELGLSLDKFARVRACHEVIGTVTKKAEAECGLSAGTPVVAGGLDAACGTLGAGVIHPGETQEQGGQAGGMSICMEEPDADRRLILGAHVVPGRFLLQGGTVAGGAAMKWFDEAFGEAFAKEKRLTAIDAAAESVPAGAGGVVFLPYLNGERSPIWDVQAKGVFYGLSFKTSRAHMARAVMEGTAFALRHNLETAYSAGAQADCLYAMGGASNSRVWTQIKADVTGHRILVPHSDQAATLGAALLAGVGTGVYADFEEAVRKTVSIRREYIPNEASRNLYDKTYEIYREIYENLKGVMAK